MSKSRLLIIIPCYNEYGRLDYEIFSQFLKQSINIEILFVDDGSTDETIKLLERICHDSDNCKFLALKNNVGKAEAIRSGALTLKEQEHSYSHIGYIDADLSVTLNEIQDMFALVKKNPQIKFLMGIRVARLGAKISRNPIRHYVGRIFATVVSQIILREVVYDTQCGAKIFDISLKNKLFDEKFVSKWLFDIELLIRSDLKEMIRGNHILEYPLYQWKDIGNSKLKIWDFIRAPYDLYNIDRAYKN